MTAWLAAGLAVSVAVNVLLGLACYYRGETKYFDGRMDEKQRWIGKTAASEHRTPEPAQGDPRENSRRTAPVAMRDLHAQAPPQRPADLPARRWPPYPSSVLAAVTAADIAPVLVPTPGPDEGKADINHHALTDSGELRALADRADQWIARMRADDAAWRQKAGLDQ